MNITKEQPNSEIGFMRVRLSHLIECASQISMELSFTANKIDCIQRVPRGEAKSDSSPTPTPETVEDMLNYLTDQMDALNHQVNGIHTRLQELV